MERMQAKTIAELMHIAARVGIGTQADGSLSTGASNPPGA
jgi:hypothetical protein